MEDIIPPEDETIAAKRSNRLFKKLDSNRHKVLTTAWWSNGISEVIFLALIFLLNLFVLYPILGTADQGTVFSGPIIPYLSQVISAVVQIPFPFAVQQVGIIAYLLFPISFYLLVKLITGRKLAAILAVLIACIPIYPFAQPRIMAGFLGADGPHMVSLGVIPWALYALLLYLRDGSMKNLIFAAILGAVIMLISPFGFESYIIFAGLLTLSEMMLGSGRLKLMRSLAVLVAVGALSSFWYNPHFAMWLIFGGLGEPLREIAGRLLPISLFALPILGTFGFLLFDRKPNLQPVFLACFWMIIFTAIIIISKNGFSPDIHSRYLMEWGIALSLLLGITIQRLVDRLKISTAIKISWLVSPLVIDFIVILLVVVLIITKIVFNPQNIFFQPEMIKTWTGVERGAIWLARENFGGLPSLIGQGISVIAVVILTIFWVKSQTKKIQAEI